MNDKERSLYLRVAEEDHHPGAQFRLALECLHQSPEDFEGAHKWLRKAYLGGQKDSSLLLGMLYQKGLGVPLNKKRAREYLLLAARDGHLEAVSQLLGNYVEDRGQGLDSLQEWSYVCKTADPTALKISQFKYPIIFDNADPDVTMRQAELMTADEDDECIKTGVLIYSALADMGFPEASRRHGILCEKGFGCTKDVSISFKRYEFAAKLNDADAQFRLGKAYLHGNGVERSAQLAFQWIKQAAENQYPEALLDLAFLYAQGIGTSSDQGKAQHCLSLAKESGVDLEKPFL